MSYKTILVRSEADWGSNRAVEVALDVAAMFDASVMGVGAEALESIAYGYAEGDLVAAVREQIKTDLAAAKTRFDASTKGASVRCSWVASSEYPLEVMNRHARAADLVVMRRPDNHPDTARSCSVTSLVMEAGLPVLLCGDGVKPLKAEQIVVAWHDRREARRAIGDAMPFLMNADCVHLVSVRPLEDTDEALAGLLEVQQRLTRHGVEVRIEAPLPSAAGLGLDLEAAAERAGADLIVSGAYGHSRLREWVLGGVTAELIQPCCGFVLLSH
jgi:nucleotide-binding universal stress UspA family protein